MFLWGSTSFWIFKYHIGFELKILILYNIVSTSTYSSNLIEAVTRAYSHNIPQLNSWYYLRHQSRRIGHRWTPLWERPPRQRCRSLSRLSVSLLTEAVVGSFESLYPSAEGHHPSHLERSPSAAKEYSTSPGGEFSSSSRMSSLLSPWNNQTPLPFHEEALFSSVLPPLSSIP